MFSGADSAFYWNFHGHNHCALIKCTLIPSLRIPPQLPITFASSFSFEKHGVHLVLPVCRWLQGASVWTIFQQMHSWGKMGLLSQQPSNAKSFSAGGRSAEPLPHLAGILSVLVFCGSSACSHSCSELICTLALPCQANNVSPQMSDVHYFWLIDFLSPILQWVPGPLEVGRCGNRYPIERLQLWVFSGDIAAIASYQMLHLTVSA